MIAAQIELINAIAQQLGGINETDDMIDSFRSAVANVLRSDRKLYVAYRTGGRLAGRGILESINLAAKGGR